MQVIHIEDRPENRLLVRKVLEANGHVVHDAPDGLSGVEMTTHVRPDLILVDINIPGLNGYEVVTRLRADETLDGVPIVAITAEGDRDHALALGFDGFIHKPIRTAEFSNQLEAFRQGYREEVTEASKVNHLIEHSRHVVDRLESRVRELELANAGLKEVDRLKMEVLRNVSHELSTPMTPIVGYVRLLIREELGEINDEQRRALGNLEGAVDRLKALVDDLLAATRFATGQSALVRKVAKPMAILSDAILKNKDFATSKRVNISLIGELTEPAIVDERRAVVALSHLISNAIKFGPEDAEVHVRTWLEVVGDNEQRYWAVSVSDTGPGIPVEEREHVCQPFYQTDGSITRQHGGAGLGLAIVEQTARAHAGDLRINDAEGGGAVVTLRLPMNPA